MQQKVRSQAAFNFPGCKKCARQFEAFFLLFAVPSRRLPFQRDAAMLRVELKDLARQHHAHHFHRAFGNHEAA